MRPSVTACNRSCAALSAADIMIFRPLSMALTAYHRAQGQGKSGSAAPLRSRDALGPFKKGGSMP